MVNVIIYLSHLSRTNIKYLGHYLGRLKTYLYQGFERFNLIVVLDVLDVFNFFYRKELYK
ncbi:hypothetical protein TUM20400_06730 [Staphylococcus aureus]|nr:hypothetical protein TUM20400_06730 [Staphylococcus aureus]